MARTHERRQLALGAHLRSVKTKLNLSLADISTTGCRVVGILDNIQEGELITIRPEGLGEFATAVVWVEGNMAGLEFDFPIHPEIVDCLCRLYPPDGRKLEATLAP